MRDLTRLGLLHALLTTWLLSSIALLEEDLGGGRSQFRAVLATPLGLVPLTDWVSLDHAELPDAWRQ